MSFDLEYGDTAELAVFLPYGIYDKLNVTYGCKKQEVDIFDGSAYLNLELLLGKHDLIMEYEDDMYPYKKVVRSINVSPIVNVPETVVHGDDAYIAVSMNEDANGNITVSIDGVEVYNKLIINGNANIPLEFSELGGHSVVIAYIGEEYSFDPVNHSCKNFIHFYSIC